MIYKYGSIVCLVISGLIAFFGSWVRLTSEMTALLRMGGNYIFDGILDYLDTGSLSVYNHLKAGKLTLLDMHKILKALGYIYEEFNGKSIQKYYVYRSLCWRGGIIRRFLCSWSAANSSC